MPISNEIPTVTFESAKATLLVCAQANIPVLLLGDPGIGKSALARYVAESRKRDLITLLGSTMDPTDIPGIPFQGPDGKSVVRFPLEAIRRAAAAPVDLFLDEISCAPPAVQAAELRLILERVAGDMPLHPETWVLAAANPPEQAPGGFELSAPLMGRVCVLRLRPKHEEVLDYLSGLGDEGTPLRAEAEDFALTAGAQPDLLQIDLPADCITGGTPWAAPRSWERAIRGRAAARASNAPNEVLCLVTEASVGRRQAMAYEGILKCRKVLPTVGEIVADPKHAKLPANAKEQVAVLGVIAHVASQNSWAGWIYAGRLDKPEYRQACAKLLQKKAASPMTAQHAKDGVQARVKLLGTLPRMSSGTP